MDYKRLYDGEARFLEIIWTHEPVRSGVLAQLSREQLGWKPSTTYTVLRRLAEKGYVVNEHAVVRSLVSREDMQAAESEYLVERSFSGSLPSFLVAFLGGKTISKNEAEELKRLIDEHQET